MAKTYMTTQGDTWDGIAFKMYKNEYYMTSLIDANPEHRETVIFFANIHLVIPEISIEKPLNLPPWKLGDTNDEL